MKCMVLCIKYTAYTMKIDNVLMLLLVTENNLYCYSKAVNIKIWIVPFGFL